MSGCEVLGSCAKECTDKWVEIQVEDWTCVSQIVSYSEADKK